MTTERYIGRGLKVKHMETIMYLRDTIGLSFEKIAPQVGLTESGARASYNKAKSAINWVEGRCPVCTRAYQYPDCKYKPKTCSNFECVQKYNRNPEKYDKGVM